MDSNAVVVFICSVFYGTYEDSKLAAVKRFQRVQLKEEETVKKEAELLLAASDHPNILRYFCTEMDDNFMYNNITGSPCYCNNFSFNIISSICRYIATERCSGTLQNLIEGTYNGPEFENEKQILKQVTKGLVHLHREGIIHRDIKPTNILIFILKSGKTERPMIKIADFGLSKVLKEGQLDLSTKNNTNPRGTRGWLAHELYVIGSRYDFKSDIFPLGCIFFCMLSKEMQHPFGYDPDKRSIRIREKTESEFLSLEYLKEDYSDDSTLNLIKSMVSIEPNDRPTAEETLQHSFFTGTELLNVFIRPNSIQIISIIDHQRQGKSYMQVLMYIT